MAMILFPQGIRYIKDSNWYIVPGQQPMAERPPVLSFSIFDKDMTMTDVASNKPFVEKLEFVGRVGKDDHIAENMFVQIEYSLLNEGEIKGKILGSMKTYEDIVHAQTFADPFLTLSSDASKNDGEECFSEKMLITKASQYSPSREITSIVGEFGLEEVTIKNTIHNDAIAERILTLFLAGPRSAWTIYSMVEHSFTGNNKSKTFESSIELDNNLPFDIKVFPWYLYDKGPSPSNYTLQTDVLVLQLEVKQSFAHLIDKEVIKLGLEIANDLTLLVSLISRAWTTWYGYKYRRKSLLETYRRDARECSKKELDQLDSLVDLVKARDFLKKSFTEYRRLRSEKIDLFLPIVYYLTGCESKYVEEQFTLFFLALERIKDTYSQKDSNLAEISAKQEYEGLEKLLKSVIKNNVSDKAIRKRIYEKLRELNRPSLKSCLDVLMKNLDIDWEGIYSRNETPTIIETRDQLFHSSQALDLKYLIKETRRLQALVERIILSILGWKDFSRSPDGNVSHWLQGDYF